MVMGFSNLEQGEKVESPEKVQRSAADIFMPVSESTKKNYPKIGVSGLAKTGKSRFLYTCPQPIRAIDTEFGITKLRKQFPGIDMQVAEIYEEDETSFESDPLACLNAVDEAVNSLKSTEGGTLCMDSGSDLWEWIGGVLRMKILKVDPTASVKPADYKWANSKYKSIIMKLLQMPCCFVITAQESEVFNDAKLTPTGMYKADWQKKTPYWVDFTIRLTKGTVKMEAYREARLKDCRLADIQNLKMEDGTYQALQKAMEPYNIDMEW